ncbi:beta-galactosidase [Patescibacteria group bacterium]|nr:beta-galactosidase [Patescibacteria group bacterium]
MAKFLLGILAFIVVVILGSIVFERIYPYPKINYGVTFSPGYASFLKLDWQKIYIQMLDDLKVRNLRVPSYWDVLEAKQNQFDFSQTDFMLDEAAKRQAKVVLVVGMRQPRWPECFVPGWAKNLSEEMRRQKILQFVRRVVDRYKEHPAIWAFQVENEPFLPFFGENCKVADAGFLKSEVDLVKSLSNRKIIVSDSGELGAWVVPMQLSDVFGTTLYRDVYNPVMGYFSYPVLPYFYYLHSQIIKNIFAPRNEKTVIIELQAEPWFAKGQAFQDVSGQVKLFPLSKMESYVNYAKKTGFDEVYLWGAEWWYLMAEHGYPEYLNYAKTLFR